MKQRMWNKNALKYLERAAARFPEKTAVEDETDSLTYRELQELAMRAGTAVAARSSERRPVPVLAEKSAYTLAAMLGVVYAGCFYVPVQPGLPQRRLEKLLAGLDCEVLISTREQREALAKAGYSGTVLYLEELFLEKADMERLTQLRVQARGNDILYGLFTSGSSGTPKCVAVSHRAVLDFIDGFEMIFGFSENDRFGNQAPFDFDVSVKDIYTSLAVGGTLVLIPRRLFTLPTRLLDYVCERRVTVLIWAVSALCIVSSLKGFEYRIPSDIHTVMFSGEVMPAGQLAVWQEALPDARFVNLYGPTEITCNCTYYEIKQRFAEGERLPIGWPFPGRYVFLLDEAGAEIVETGKSGEICVSGMSLSEGYYRDPEQTRQRFFMHTDAQGVRRNAYRTGDLGYYGPYGELYFDGRKDFQIKYMGHRIELEEVELAMTGNGRAQQACCLFDGSGIYAFYTGAAEAKELRREVKKTLPSYMVPCKMIRLDRMPLNKNGKTDRQALRGMIGGRKREWN